MKTLITHFVLGAALLVPTVLSAQTAYTEALINLPWGAPQASGIDDNNQIVGSYYDSGNIRHGFLWTNGVVAQIDAPGADSTSTLGINSKTGIVGYAAGAKNVNGILDAKRRISDVKGSSERFIFGINASGSFVGIHNSSGAGFININGVYTTVKPDVCNGLEAPVSVYVVGINAHNDFVGVCFDVNSARSIGFSSVGGVYQAIVAFGQTTYPYGINDAGTIVGLFGGTDNSHGFVMTSGGAVTQFDYNGASQTSVSGINNSGSLTGIAYVSGQWTGFYALAN